MQVIVRVYNRLISEVTSVHFHGVYQRRTNFMDGVPYLTQCPILPRQFFAYAFRAEPPGTHWYHSHQAAQRLDGLYGMFIVHRRLTPPLPSIAPQIPVVAVLSTLEYALFVADWYHVGHATMTSIRHGYGVQRPLGTGEQLLDIARRSYSFDGIELTTLRYVSSLVDGRGRWSPPGDDGPPAPFPLAEYRVEPGRRHRFRMAHAGAEYAYAVSVDGHRVDVVAVDGNDVEPIRRLSAVIIFPGESVDFEFDADRRPPSRYWLRAETLTDERSTSVDGDDEPQENQSRPPPESRPWWRRQEARAIIVYDGSPEPAGTDPTSTSTTGTESNCTAETPCRVFNCPFPFYPPAYNRSCVSVADARSPPPRPAAPATGGSSDFDENSKSDSFDVKYGLNDDDDDAMKYEFFLNTAFVVGSSVNARQFVPPRSPLVGRTVGDGDDGALSADDRYVRACSAKSCVEVDCRQCTNILSLPFNVTVTLVLLNYEPSSPYVASHSVHLHGHSFAVLRVGYPPNDPATGRYAVGRTNTDIHCDTSDLCAAARWSNVSSADDGRQQPPPTLNVRRPPVKDTVVVPVGGYVVVRFRSDNPGYWLLHCHQELHSEEGMAMVFNVAPGRHRPPPAGFPTCGDFNLTAGEAQRYLVAGDEDDAGDIETENRKSGSESMNPMELRLFAVIMTAELGFICLMVAQIPLRLT